MTRPTVAALAVSATAAPRMLTVEVLGKTEIAEQIYRFELGPRDGQTLPPFTAGAHLAVETPRGLVRRYSLCNSPSERNRYVIAVKRDAVGGGGSASMADTLHVGDVLKVNAPENYFPLAETATQSRYLLIAGGIGITPILSMMHELEARGADFKLVYCTRSPSTAAFLDELSASRWAQRVIVHHDHGDPARAFALASLLEPTPQHMHLYCCGPRPLMQAVRELSRHWPAGTVHFEDFGTSTPTPSANDARHFSVRLVKRGITVDVPPEKTILEALREHGVDVPSSCESGTCGSCRTRLIAGKAEHRDFVLDDDEHDDNIMICVSRACSNELVLDL